MGEVRDRASSWSLKDDEVKELTKEINAHGKKGWEKVMKQWQSGPTAQRLKTKLEEAALAERAAKDKAAKEAEEKARDEDEDRKAAVAELERKRKEKKAEKDRVERKKKADEEQAKREPEMQDPAVIA